MRFQSPSWFSDPGWIYWPVGAVWLIASRLGFELMGFSGKIVILTAVHFYFAGLAAPLIAGLAGRYLEYGAGGLSGEAESRGARVWQRIYRMSALVLAASIPLTAARIFFVSMWFAATGESELSPGRIDDAQSRVLLRHPIAAYDFDGSLNAGPHPAQVRLDPDRRRMLLIYEVGRREILGRDANFALSAAGAPQDSAQSAERFPGLLRRPALFVEAEDFESSTAIVRTGATAPRIDLARLRDIGGFTALAISSDGCRIATGSEDMLVRIWKAPASTQ